MRVGKYRSMHIDLTDLKLQNVDIGERLSIETVRRIPTMSDSAPLGPPAQTQTSARDAVRLLTRAGRVIASQQDLSAAVAFWSKIVRDPRAIADWIAFSSDHFKSHGAREPNARELRKPQRNCGILGRSVRQRVDALKAHYTFAESHLPPPMHRALLDLGQLPVARVAARGTTFDLCLGSSLPYGQKQEGELTVWLTNSDGLSLARMAFSFGIDAGGAASLLIGGLQGLTAHQDKKLIVTATRQLSGLRPKDAVLVAVQGVARALDIHNVYAVSNATHVLAAEWFMSNSVISRDYDSFWKERGGIPEPGIGYLLPPCDYGARVTAAKDPRLLDRHRASISRQVEASILAE